MAEMMTPAIVAVDYTTEIIALRKAIAGGVLTASYDGKSVTYDDLEGLRRRLSLVEGWQRQLLEPNYRRPTAGFAVFSRGNR